MSKRLHYEDQLLLPVSLQNITCTLSHGRVILMVITEHNLKLPAADRLTCYQPYCTWSSVKDLFE